MVYQYVRIIPCGSWSHPRPLWCCRGTPPLPHLRRSLPPMLLGNPRGGAGGGIRVGDGEKKTGAEEVCFLERMIRNAK